MRTNMISATRRQLSTTPTGRPVPAAHPLNRGPAAGYGGQGGYGAPTPGGGPPHPSQKPSGGSKTLPLVALVAVIGGIGAYYATMDDPKAAVKTDARRLEQGAKHEVDALRAGGARSDSRSTIDASDSRRQLERAKDGLTDAATPHKSWTDSLKLPHVGSSNTSDEAHLAQKAQGVVEDVKDTAKSWGRSLKGESDAAWHGHGEGVKNEILRWKQALSSPDGKMGVEQVEEYLRSKGHYTTTMERYPLFDFFGTAPSLRKTQVETSLNRYEREGESFINSTLNKASAEYEKAKSAVKDAGRDVSNFGRDVGRDAKNIGQDAKSETKSWFSWGENKAEKGYYNAKADAKDAANSVSRTASNAANDVSRSVSNATEDVEQRVGDATRNAIPVAAETLRQGYDKVERNVKDAYNTTADKANSAYNQAANTADRAYNSAANTADRAADDAARAARDAESKVKSEGKSWFNWSENKAEEAKSSVKSGLLAAERSVEHGAQKAQDETKKL